MNSHHSSTADNAPAHAPALVRAADATLSEQLAQRFAQRIQQRLLAPGTRLPSVRDCAKRHGVSPSTVVSAYDQLQAQCLVQARPQRGYFVRERTGLARAARAPAPPAGARGPRGSLTAPVDATALIRSMFQSQGGLPAPAMGTLPEDWLDPALLQRALRRVATHNATGWLSYGDPAGDPALRQALSQRLADLGLAAPAQQIVTTLGASQALDLVSRILLQPGDAVLVDEPGWAVEFARLGRAGMRLLPVPRGADGPDLVVMKRLLEAHRPRLYITVSVLHNPTGAMLSPGHAHQVLQLAQQFDFTIVEDDTYAWFAPPHATRMAQLDGLQRTVYISGFSKIVAPQWRVGFVAAAPALVEQIIDTKLLTTLTTPAVMEQALAWCLTQGSLRRHADRVSQRLDAARERSTRLAREAGCHFVTPPQGLFGWVDTGMDTERLAADLLDEGWLVAPGTLFHASPTPGTLMRVNFATTQDARFWRRLAQARLARKRSTG
jgi:DNA-binding transcriptional MocR family regulator